MKISKIYFTVCVVWNKQHFTAVSGVLRPKTKNLLSKMRQKEKMGRASYAPK
jgi:hypothetical protein